MVWCGTYALDQGMAFTKVLFERQAEPGASTGDVRARRDTSNKDCTCLCHIASSSFDFPFLCCSVRKPREHMLGVKLLQLSD